MGRYISFKSNESVLEWKIRMIENDNSIHNICLMNSDMFEYHDSTPLTFILKEQPFLQINYTLLIAMISFEVIFFYF